MAVYLPKTFDLPMTLYLPFGLSGGKVNCDTGKQGKTMNQVLFIIEIIIKE